jgi:predicted transcriptional regulator
MRTTFDLNDELLRRVKRAAAAEGTSLKAVVERALRAHLGGGGARRGYRLNWRADHGRVLPGVRLDDRDALFDLMGGR